MPPLPGGLTIMNNIKLPKSFEFKLSIFTIANSGATWKMASVGPVVSENLRTFCPEHNSETTCTTWNFEHCYIDLDEKCSVQEP